MPEAQNQEAWINAFIEKSVNDYWAERSEALLLSYLGSNLKNIFPDSDSILAKGLRRHLVSWPIVTIVTHPTQPQKIGLIPLSVPIPNDVESLFAKRDRVHAPRLRSDFTVFRQDFWNLFLSKSRKYVVVTGDQNFLIADAPLQNPVSGTSYEVRDDDQVSVPLETPVFEKAKLVRDKIDAWLQRNGLDRRIFESQRSTAHESSEVSLNLFDALRALDPADQARISIPLDIVIKIFKAPPK